MSNLAFHASISTESAYEASLKHSASKTRVFVTVMAFMVILAIAGVAMARPGLTALAGLCTLIAAFCAIYSFTDEIA